MLYDGRSHSQLKLNTPLFTLRHAFNAAQQSSGLQQHRSLQGQRQQQSGAPALPEPLEACPALSAA
jgi:hypothetical protein